MDRLDCAMRIVQTFAGCASGASQKEDELHREAIAILRKFIGDDSLPLREPSFFDMRSATEAASHAS